MSSCWRGSDLRGFLVGFRKLEAHLLCLHGKRVPRVVDSEGVADQDVPRLVAS